MRIEQMETDVLIIGGGTAGCFAAVTLARRAPELRILIAEKANIKRSGCLAAGVNAINAYITKGRRPQDYADYAARDAGGIVRDDLLLSMAGRLNHVTEEMEKLGLVILKDENGEYVERGDRNIKINGENIKPILAGAVASYGNITVLNHINITDYLTEEDGEGGACTSEPIREPRGAEGTAGTNIEDGVAGIGRGIREPRGAEDTAGTNIEDGVAGIGGGNPEPRGAEGTVESNFEDGATGIGAVSSEPLEDEKVLDPGSDNWSGRRIRGAVGFSVQGGREEGVAYILRADRVICATGGAAGLYRPNNPGFSRHKMWYPPFNTGAGYAMGIRAGAEMTTLEMRFIALRCKDTIAPTGTIAQGVGAKQTNSRGEVYESRYGLSTSERLYGTVTENREGRGPCYLDTRHISKEQEEDLLRAYLNMAPSQTLKWLESGTGPSEQPVEVEGTEPYIVGGHTASGYWIDDGRRTTVRGLYAAGDVAGGAPQKYVTGALAEGEIAAESVLADREAEVHADKVERDEQYQPADHILTDAQELIREYEAHLDGGPVLITIDQLEQAMQKVMDEYAGGITKDYQFNERSLELAGEKLGELERLLPGLCAEDMDDLMRIYEIRERLTVCRFLLVHLRARRETRWHSFAENMDYPERDERFERYVNTRCEGGEIRVLYRGLVRRGDAALEFATWPGEPAAGIRRGQVRREMRLPNGSR